MVNRIVRLGHLVMATLLTQQTHHTNINGEGPLWNNFICGKSTHGCKGHCFHTLGVDYGSIICTQCFFARSRHRRSGNLETKRLSLKEYHGSIFYVWSITLGIIGFRKRTAEGWDGRYKGTLLLQDVYVWKIQAIFTDGKAVEA